MERTSKRQIQSIKSSLDILSRRYLSRLDGFIFNEKSRQHLVRSQTYSKHRDSCIYVMEMGEKVPASRKTSITLHHIEGNRSISRFSALIPLYNNFHLDLHKAYGDLWSLKTTLLQTRHEIERLTICEEFLQQRHLMTMIAFRQKVNTYFDNAIRFFQSQNHNEVMKIYRQRKISREESIIAKNPSLQSKNYTDKNPNIYTQIHIQELQSQKEHYISHIDMVLSCIQEINNKVLEIHSNVLTKK